MISDHLNPILAQGAATKLKTIRSVIMVGSGKGGVGKSLVSCALAVELAKKGHRTGLIDLDLHGASLESYFGRARPVRSGRSGMKPNEFRRVKTMSVSFFTDANPVPVKGESKERLIMGLMALTDWGELDYLVVDLPPGTGDEVIAAFSLFRKKSRLLLVTTPSSHSTKIVSRLLRLAREERVRILGVVLNMSFMQTGRTVSFPFGRRSRSSIEREIGARIVGELPLDTKVSSQNLWRALSGRGELVESVRALCTKIVG